MELLGRPAGVAVEFATQPSLDRILPNVDVVLSCGSTGGIEAAALGWPVIQLLPSGSGDLLPAEASGLLGTARGEAELAFLLPLALQRGVRGGDESVRENRAAGRIVELVLGRVAPRISHDSGQAIPEPQLLEMAG